jgi:hypothetical protein
MAAESSQSAVLAWLEPVALLGASRRAARLSTEARARLQPWVVAAQSRFRVARELRDAETQTVALALLREAAFFALCALEAVESTADSPKRSPAQAWERFDALPQKPPGAPEQLGLVRAAFGTDAPLSVDLVPPSAANELRLAAEESVAWLLSLVEVRTPPELARARVIRSALALVGLVVVVWGLVAYWLSLAALEPR